MLSSNSGSDRFFTCTVSILGQSATHSYFQKQPTPDSRLEHKRLDVGRTEEVFVVAELSQIFRRDEVVVFKQRYESLASFMVFSFSLFAERTSSVGVRRPAVVLGHQGDVWRGLLEISLEIDHDQALDLVRVSTRLDTIFGGSSPH